jgi:neuroligin
VCQFNEINQNYLLLGIPPVLSSRYRHHYVKFWNEGLLDTMKNYNNFNNNHQQTGGIYGKAVLEPSSATVRRPHIEIGHPIKGEMGVNSHSKDPIRELFRLQQQPRDSSSHFHYPSTFSHQNNNDYSNNNKNVMMITTTLTSTDQPIIHQQISSGDEEIFKSETTAFLLIAVIVTFLVVNIVGLGIYLYRRGKKLNRKYDNTNLYDTTTSNDDKRSKYNDTDESFILRKSNNTYESVKRHSPINGFGIRRQISSSTVDTHAKVIGWMSTDEENKKRAQNSTFSTLKREKVSVAIDATPQARSNSILRQEPIKITKAKSSFD